MTSSSKNYYNPFGAVLLALIIFFLPVTFLYIILGITESLLDRDLLNQNPVNININGLETTLYPIKDNLLYLLSIPIQIWLMILFLKSLNGVVLVDVSDTALYDGIRISSVDYYL